jgi:hypothetical protein
VKRIGAITVLAVLLAACGAAPKAGPSSVQTTLAGTLGYHLTSAQVETSGPLAAQAAPSATPQPGAPPEPKGQCDAPSLTYLIGRPRTEIPVPADLSRRRVVCTHCPGNTDYQPTRTNILFDPATGRITAVKCG